MKILERMALLVKADAHGVMDQLEERSLLMKQHLREAELELTHKRARLEALEEQERCLGEEAGRMEVRVAALDADVELALAGEKEELARFALRRLLPLREAARERQSRAAELREGGVRLAAELESQEAQLDALRARVRSALAAEAAPRAADVPADGVAEEEVELELLRRRGPAAAVEGAE